MAEDVLNVNVMKLTNKGIGLRKRIVGELALSYREQGMTLREIGEYFGVQKERARQYVHVGKAVRLHLKVPY